MQAQAAWSHSYPSQRLTVLWASLRFRGPVRTRVLSHEYAGLHCVRNQSWLIAVCLHFKAVETSSAVRRKTRLRVSEMGLLRAAEKFWYFRKGREDKTNPAVMKARADLRHAQMPQRRPATLAFILKPELR